MPANLQKAFDFDEADLRLNQTGRLSDAQRQRIERYRRVRQKGGKLALGAMLLTSGFWLAMWLWGIGLKFEREKHLELTIAFFAALGFIWLLFLFFSWLGRARSDLMTEKVSTVEGVVKLTQKKLPRSLGTAYYGRIDGVKFQFETEAQFAALEADAPYRVFYLKNPPTQIVLSIVKKD